jgi:N-acetylglucosamine kinase-like BadF-type ATPase
VRVVADPVVAFAAGTPARHGAVLIGGTGTIAAMIASDEVIRRIDGHGWLVGDDGSGFWLGRQAVRAVLAELDGRAEPTVLRYAVLATLTGSDRIPDTTAQQLDVLSSRVYGAPPIALARLAALVPAAAETGDRAAQRIVDRAVTLLVDTIEALLAREPGDCPGPLVLAGTVLTAHGPIRREVRRRITQRLGLVPLLAGSGAGGAAWLAARQAGIDLDPVVHERLTAPETVSAQLSGL